MGRLLGGALLFTVLACGGAEEPVTASVVNVEAPADLAQLDPVVIEQYEAFRRDLEVARHEAGGRESDPQWGAAWGKLGRWFEVYGYEASAALAYSNAAQLDPNEARWPYHRGRLAATEGRYEAALEDLRRAAELAPEAAAPRVRWADLALARQRLDEAEALYGEVLKVDPDQPGALLGRARLALARQEPEAAIRDLERLARSQPEASPVNYTLGLAWRQAGDRRRAASYLARVPEDNTHQVMLDHGFAWDRELNSLDLGSRTLTRRGVRAAGRGQAGRAAVLFGRAVAADPDGPEKRINYGLALRNVGRWPGAEEELRRAADLAEAGSGLARRAHQELGRLLADRGRPEEAVVQFEAALSIDPDSVPAHIALGRLRQRQGDLAAAVRYYGAVVDREETPPAVRGWHAALLLAEGRWREARQALEAEMERPWPARHARLLLARLLVTAPASAESAEDRDAVRDRARARKLLAGAGPIDVLLAETAAMVTAAEGRFEEAVAWQEAAVAGLEDLSARSAAHTARRRRVLYRRGEAVRTPWERGERLVMRPVEPPPGQTLVIVGAAGSSGTEDSTREGLEGVPSDLPEAADEPFLDLDLDQGPEPGRFAGGTGGAGEGGTDGSTAPRWVDVAPRVGLDFEHDNGGAGEFYFVEPVGAGGALVDLDDDGDLDAVLIQGGALGEASPASPSSGVGSRVFRNELIGGAGSGGSPGRERGLAFTEVTADSGLTDAGYGMGVATGDYDGDGRIDLYITGFGANRLWRNVTQEGRIRFEDVTARAGVDDPRWSTSAAFADLDADGDLDLFVTHYVDFTLAGHRPCRSAGGRLDYCGPLSYGGETDRLFLNRGDGTFRDITRQAGLNEAGSGLGVVSSDFDRDGRLDLYVANDLERNFLWRNLGLDEAGVPRFENVALAVAAAVSALGRSQASMGVVAGDVDNDGDDDLFMTHLSADTNTLYVNDGSGMFRDRSAASGLGNPSMAGTGFGTGLLDFDNDGWLDIFVANGAVKVIEAQVRAGDEVPLKQRNQLFANRQGRFEEVSAESGPELERLEVSRGVAVGDVDNDGRSDLLLTNNAGPARLLMNRAAPRSPGQAGAGHRWLGLRLVTAEGRDALGARVEVELTNGEVLWRRAATDGSYLSANDPRVLVGLGDAAAVAELRVHWPDGTVEAWSGLALNRYHRLVVGQGEAEP